MGAMRTVYAKSGTNDHGRHSIIVKGKRASFVNNTLFCWIVWCGRCVFEMRHSFLYFFSLVRISEFLYPHFSSTCVRLIRISSRVARSLHRVPFSEVFITDLSQSYAMFSFQVWWAPRALSARYLSRNTQRSETRLRRQCAAPWVSGQLRPRPPARARHVRLQSRRSAPRRSRLCSENPTRYVQPSFLLRIPILNL